MEDENRQRKDAENERGDGKHQQIVVVKTISILFKILDKHQSSIKFVHWIGIKSFHVYTVIYVNKPISNYFNLIFVFLSCFFFLSSIQYTFLFLAITKWIRLFLLFLFSFCFLTKQTLSNSKATHYRANVNFVRNLNTKRINFLANIFYSSFSGIFHNKKEKKKIVNNYYWKKSLYFFFLIGNSNGSRRVLTSISK